MSDPHERVQAAWKTASQLLSVRVVAPYCLDCGGSAVARVVHLPDFGGPKGMVFDLLQETPADFAGAAKAQELFVSLLNPEVYGAYDEVAFKEALIDWGFYGEESRRPAWYPKTPEEARQWLEAH